MQETNQNAQQRRRLIRLLFLVLVSSVFVIGLVLIPSARLQENRPGKSLAGDFSNDDGTRASRDRTNALIRVVVRSAADLEMARKMGVLVEDYGSYVVIAGAKETETSSSKLETSLLETTVNLPGKSFEPIQESPVETIRALSLIHI